jgi:hypothetical protein
LAKVDAKEHAQRLDQDEPGCRCQHFSVSEYSPASVDNAETLIRIVIVPHHIHTKSGSPRAAVLTHAENIGMSVFREERATNDEIRATAERLVHNARTAALKQGKNKEKEIGVFGVLRVSCGEIRSFRLAGEPEPSYCVYDTATEAALAHADAFQRIANVSPEVILARRTALFDQIKGSFVSVDEFRGGLLKSLAPERES